MMDSPFGLAISITIENMSFKLTNMLYLIKDGKIDSEEFKFCWDNWLKKILWPVSCLLSVDVQNDFISGSLALKNCPACEDGEDIVPVINDLISKINFNFHAFSLDWHPKDHISFIDNIKTRKIHSSSKVVFDKASRTNQAMFFLHVSAATAKLFDNVIFEGPVEQIMWPVHCIQNSWGSEFHCDLVVPPKSIIIRKGINSDIDSYSAFYDNCKRAQTNLSAELTDLHVTDVYVCGLAYDVCVGATAKDALELGFRTILIEDASRGVTEDNIKSTKNCLICQDAAVVNSNEVKAMVEGLDRRPELAHRAALALAN
ncbi:Nicotinamidase [Nymphon striatum]|nr:Nicotinamidase [Nymphon striatum]